MLYCYFPLQGQCASCGADNTKCASFGMQSIQYPLGDRVNIPLYFDTGKDAPYIST